MASSALHTTWKESTADNKKPWKVVKLMAATAAVNEEQKLEAAEAKTHRKAAKFAAAAGEDLK